MSIICVRDIVRDFAVRTSGREVEATVIDLRQLAADEYELELTMSIDRKVEQFKRKLLRRNLDHYRIGSKFTVNYSNSFRNYIVVKELDKPVWFGSAAALLGFTLLMVGVLKKRI